MCALPIDHAIFPSTTWRLFLTWPTLSNQRHLTQFRNIFNKSKQRRTLSSISQSLLFTNLTIYRQQIQFPTTATMAQLTFNMSTPTNLIIVPSQQFQSWVRRDFNNNMLSTIRSDPAASEVNSQRAINTFVSRHNIIYPGPATNHNLNISWRPRAALKQSI